ncbi:MAG: hypothetical protein JW963_05350 [Anaerolineales bacterium]|nr:hypothetical protein [Anaerolineales bacterium]
MKKDFLRLIALSNTQSSSFQRANVYESKSPEKRQSAFVQEFRSKLVALEKVYEQPVSPDQHIKNIEEFAQSLSKHFPDVLRGEEMRIGVAQKAINLYLKFLWCYGWIPEPPHCPIDRTVLEKVGDYDAWTKIDSIQKYMEKIDKIEARKGDKSFSEWEYELWKNGNHITSTNETVD